MSVEAVGKPRAATQPSLSSAANHVSVRPQGKEISGPVAESSNPIEGSGVDGSVSGELTLCFNDDRFDF